MAANRAFTLLEVLLALAFTALAIVLMGMAIKVNADVVNKSSAQVLQAQMARELLQRIAYDISQAAPYQSSSGSASDGSGSTSGGSASTSGGSSSTSSGSSSGSMSSSGSGSSSSGSTSSSGSSSTTPLCGGIFGDAQAIRVEACRRPRVTRSMLAAQDGTQPAAVLGDLRVISYTLGQPNGPSTGAPTSSNDSNGGLYRGDMEREQYYSALQQGSGDTSDTSEKLGDPNVGEVVDLKFSYFDGSTENEEWDSIQQGKLPSAVRVTISIRPAAPGGSSGSVFGSLGAGSDKQRPVKSYDILVYVPNASVPANAFQTLAQADPVPRSGMRSSAGTAGSSSGAGMGSSSSGQ